PKALYSTGTVMKQTGAAADLRTPLQFIKGVGPQRASQLERKGLRTVEDALFFVPLRHEDRTRPTPFRPPVPAQAAHGSGATRRGLRARMWRLVESYAAEVDEVLPEGVRTRRGLVGLAQAVKDAHFPQTDSALAAARRRLSFDEGLLLQLGLAILRTRVARAR